MVDMFVVRSVNTPSGARIREFQHAIRNTDALNKPNDIVVNNQGTESTMADVFVVLSGILPAVLKTSGC